MLLEVNDLSISYGKGNPVVHGVSFSVDKGKILAIIGESGSGRRPSSALSAISCQGRDK